MFNNVPYFILPIWVWHMLALYLIFQVLWNVRWLMRLMNDHARCRRGWWDGVHRDT